MHDQGVAVAQESQRLGERRPVGRLAGVLVHAGAVDLDVDQLPVGPLIGGADSQVPDMNRPGESGELGVPRTHRGGSNGVSSIGTYLEPALKSLGLQLVLG